MVRNGPDKLIKPLGLNALSFYQMLLGDMHPNAKVSSCSCSYMAPWYGHTLQLDWIEVPANGFASPTGLYNTGPYLGTYVAL